MTCEYDTQSRRINSTYIGQGEYAVSCNSDEVISTILGSCVATCLWDSDTKIGGMNHFLLPDGPHTPNGHVSSFGANSMELLINALIRNGADRNRLRAKVFGGAEMYRGLTDAGARNGDFVTSYLERESIPCDGMSLGGGHARRIEFDPTTGRARQKFVADHCVMEKMDVQEVSNDLEIF